MLMAFACCAAECSKGHVICAGVHTLDLSNTMVDDTDISHVMSQCSNIRVLKLAGCRKLTSVSLTLFGSTTGTFKLTQFCNQTTAALELICTTISQPSSKQSSFSQLSLPVHS